MMSKHLKVMLRNKKVDHFRLHSLEITLYVIENPILCLSNCLIVIVYQFSNKKNKCMQMAAMLNI